MGGGVRVFDFDVPVVGEEYKGIRKTSALLPHFPVVL